MATKAELQALAQEHGLEVPSKATNAELEAALKEAGVELPAEDVSVQTDAYPESLQVGGGRKYYRSRLSGLTIVLNADADDERGILDPEKIEKVRFRPFLEEWRGDTIKVGYLSTADKEAQARLAADANVEEIDEAEFVKATRGDQARPSGY